MDTDADFGRGGPGARGQGSNDGSILSTDGVHFTINGGQEQAVDGPVSSDDGGPPLLAFPGARPAPQMIGKQMSPQDLQLQRGAEDTDTAVAAQANAEEQQNQASARFVSFLSLAASFVAAFLGLGIGITDSELALVGFGMEALLDALSSALVLWRFKKPKLRQHEDEEAAMRFQAARDLKRERNSGIGIGVTFVASSALLLCSAAMKLVAWDPKEPTHVEAEVDGANWSLIFSIPSAVIFGAFAYRKFQLADALHSQVLRKDALCSVLGAFLAAICAAAGIAEEFSGDPEKMVAVDAIASALIALILFVEGSRTLWHNLGSGWEEEHQQMS